MEKNGMLYRYAKLFYRRYVENAFLPFEPLRIRELRVKYQQKKFLRGIPLAWFTGSRVSIYLSLVFVRLGFRPDWVSFSMIPVGLLASVFFFLRFPGAICIGYILLHLWFALDLSDGEVARMTNNCSSYGKGYDCLIHIITHLPIIMGITYYIFISSRSTLAIWFGMLYLIMNLIYRAKLPLDIYMLRRKVTSAYYKNRLIRKLRRYFVTVPALILYLTFVELVRLADPDVLLPSFIFFVIMSSIVVVSDLGHEVFEILRGDFC